jgi:predicted lipid carrier protein YhbT
MPTNGDALVTPETVSKEVLRALFEAAYMETRLDNDGDLVVSERYNVWVLPSPGGSYLRLMAPFRAAEQAEEDAKLRFVNTVNQQLIMICAYVGDGGALFFEHYISVEGGVTKKNIVLTVRKFGTLLAKLGEFDAENVLE